MFTLLIISKRTSLTFAQKSTAQNQQISCPPRCNSPQDKKKVGHGISSNSLSDQNYSRYLNDFLVDQVYFQVLNLIDVHHSGDSTTIPSRNKFRLNYIVKPNLKSCLVVYKRLTNEVNTQHVYENEWCQQTLWHDYNNWSSDILRCTKLC